MKAELITWQDAVSEDEWEDIEKAKDLELHTIFTLGFLLHEDDCKIILAHNWDSDREGVSQHIAIPKGWILDRREIDLGDFNP